MFKFSDKDRKIIIKDTNGSEKLLKDHIYEIEEVYNKQKIRIKKPSVNWIANPEDYAFVDNVLNIGDKVILLKTTASLKEGDEKTVINFLDGNRDRVILEGIVPGGWVSASYLEKLVDLSMFRIKTLNEIVHEYGLDYQNKIGNPIELNLYGKDFKDITPIQTKDGIHLKTEKTLIRLPYDFYTSEPVVKVKFYIQNLKTLQDMGLTGSMLSILKPYSNVLAEEMGIYFEEDPKSLYNACKEVSTHAYFTIRVRNVISRMHYLTIRTTKIKDGKKENKKGADPALPF